MKILILILSLLIDLSIYFTIDKVNIKTKYIIFIIFVFLMTIFDVHPKGNIFIESFFYSILILLFEISAHSYIYLRATFTPYLARKKILPIEFLIKLQD